MSNLRIDSFKLLKDGQAQELNDVKDKSIHDMSRLPVLSG